MGRASAITLAIALTVGCGASNQNSKINYDPPAVILPSHIKTIAIRPFANTTAAQINDNKLWLATVQRFLKDGRVAYIDDEGKADGVIVGTLKYYRNLPLSQDANRINTEFQLTVIMDLDFLDRTKQQYLWEEPNLERKLRYLSDTQPGGKTEEQAREELWQQFAEDIVRRTMDGFGSVTSVSPRAVPNVPKLH